MKSFYGIIVIIIMATLEEKDIKNKWNKKCRRLRNERWRESTGGQNEGKKYI